MIAKPIVPSDGKPTEQPKVIMPKTSRIWDKIVPIPNDTIPHKNPKMIQVLEWLKERLYQILVGKFLFTLIWFIDPLLNQ